MPNLKHNHQGDEIGGRSSYPNMVKGGPGSAQSLALEPVYDGDEFVEMWISVDGDGPSLKLAPQQCYELGGELLNLARVLGFRKPEPVPPQVLAAEARRESRQLLNRSSLACPTGDCDHLASYHSASDYDDDGDPIDPCCDVIDCRCPRGES